MKFIIGAALLASLVAAAPSAVRDDPASPLSVRLEMAGNSQVRAVFTNTGEETLKLLKTGTVFSKHATRKASVTADGTSRSCPRMQCIASGFVLGASRAECASLS